MRRLALIVALFIASLSPAFAFDTPRALLQALYAPYSKGDSFDWSKWDETKFRSAALNALFAADLKQADGDVGRLDFDPYIDGQDYAITKLKIGAASIVGKTAKVDVTFRNFKHAEHLTFSLVDEASGWKVDDVVSSTKGYEYSLKAIMSAPLPTGGSN